MKVFYPVEAVPGERRGMRGIETALVAVGPEKSSEVGRMPGRKGARRCLPVAASPMNITLILTGPMGLDRVTKVDGHGGESVCRTL